MIQSIDALRGRRDESGEPVGPGSGAAESAPVRVRNRLAGSGEPDAGERLVRKLAADHLRELRDDGLTIDYVARMYGVSPERMEILYGELLPSPPR